MENAMAISENIFINHLLLFKSTLAILGHNVVNSVRATLTSG